LLLYRMVGVEDGKLKPPGKLPPDGGFTRTGQADKADHSPKTQ
jgi:hypothetical protein